MEKILLKGTFETPSVVLDFEQGKLELSGRSLPEDTTSFYRPILNWVEQYIEQPKEATDIAIKLEYFNTATSKVLLNLLTKLARAGNVTVHWFHYEEDEDMLESGKEFEELVNLPFAYHTFD